MTKLGRERPFKNRSGLPAQWYEPRQILLSDWTSSSSIPWIWRQSATCHHRRYTHWPFVMYDAAEFVGFVTSSLHWCRSMKGSLDCFRWNVVSLLLSVAIFLPLTPPSFSKLKIKLVEIPKFQWNFCSPICLSPKRIDWTVCWPKIVYLFSTAMPTEIDETTSLVNLVCWHFWSTFRTVRPTIS